MSPHEPLGTRQERLPRRPVGSTRVLRITVAAVAAVVVLTAGGWALHLLRPDGATSAGAPASAPARASGSPVGSLPSAAPIVVSHQSNVTITGKTFRGIAGQPAIVIENSHHVVISGNDFVDDSEPIYVSASTDVTIEGNRYRNITGPHERNGSHRGNFTQWVDSTGGSIVRNTGMGGDTEDIVSIYHSGGRSHSDPLLIADNVFVGTNWTSGSGSGILIGDNGGSHVLVRGNTLVNPGQVGIGVAGGTDMVVTGNVVSGVARTHSNVGIYVWNLTGGPCTDITVSTNTVEFYKADGTRSDLYDGGGCGTLRGLDSNRTG